MFILLLRHLSATPKCNSEKNSSVGLAPEGEVSVFLIGIGTTVEVVNNLCAQEVDTDWTAILNNKKISRSERIRKRLGETLTDEEIKNLQTNGIPKGLMDSYRQQYPWKPEYKNCKLKQMIFRTLNGETEYFHLNKFKNIRNKRGIIKSANIHNA